MLTILAALALAALLDLWPDAWPLAWPAIVAVLAWRLFRPRRQHTVPLDDPDLATAIQAVATPLGLRPILLVAPGDGPPNAGIRGRRLVFQESLLRLPRDQIIAVAAHELGHRYHRHHEQYLAVQALLALAVVLLGKALIELLGSPYPAVALLFLTPPLHHLRHRFEYEADAVAARHDAAAFAAALKALDRGVAGPYPTLAQRLRRLPGT